MNRDAGLPGGVKGVGIDVVDIERFRRSMARTPGLLDRLFVAEELDYVRAKADPVPSLAARFAAREAVMKALGVGLGAFGFHEVWVRRDPGGAPSLSVTGAAHDLASARGVSSWHLSLSHTSSTAVAFVIAG